MKAHLVHVDGLRFRAKAEEAPEVLFDAGDQETRQGPSPARGALVSAMACTAADVVLILRNQRVSFTSLELEADARRATETPNLVQIGIMDSVYFPTVALVRDGQPMNPVRIYAGPKMDDRDQIVVFISEFQPPPNLIKGIAATVLDWAQDARCNLLVCPEGLIVDAREDDGDRQVEVYGIGSTDKTMDMIRKNNITVFEEGVITGVAGVLLNEGRKRDFDVITLLSEAHPDYPDARAAARAIEVIDKLLLHTELDAWPLYEEAERIEQQLKNIHHQTEVAKKPSEPARPSMYG